MNVVTILSRMAPKLSNSSSFLRGDGDCVELLDAVLSTASLGVSDSGFTQPLPPMLLCSNNASIRASLSFNPLNKHITVPDFDAAANVLVGAAMADVGDKVFPVVLVLDRSTKSLSAVMQGTHFDALCDELCNETPTELMNKWMGNEFAATHAKTLSRNASKLFSERKQEHQPYLAIRTGIAPYLRLSSPKSPKEVKALAKAVLSLKDVHKNLELADSIDGTLNTLLASDVKMGDMTFYFFGDHHDASNITNVAFEQAKKLVKSTPAAVIVATAMLKMGGANPEEVRGVAVKEASAQTIRLEALCEPVEADAVTKKKKKPAPVVPAAPPPPPNRAHSKANEDEDEEEVVIEQPKKKKKKVESVEK